MLFENHTKPKEQKGNKNCLKNLKKPVPEQKWREHVSNKMLYINCFIFVILCLQFCVLSQKQSPKWPFKHPPLPLEMFLSYHKNTHTNYPSLLSQSLVWFVRNAALRCREGIGSGRSVTRSPSAGKWSICEGNRGRTHKIHVWYIYLHLHLHTFTIKINQM